MSKDKPNVVVAMSGGVDSSVAAALLIEQGYKVSGMMLRLWSEPGQESENSCCTPDAIDVSKKVSALLGIPFQIVNAKDLFRKTVVEYFLNGYAQGITPNPCLLCNKRIKWHFLLDHARLSGAEYLATGHYARLKKTQNHPIQLFQALDKEKDQSYVLSNLTQAQLRHTLLPLGDYKKDEVREIANKFNLPSSTIKDSQDLCFLGGKDYHSFIKRYANGIEKPGPITTPKGEFLGEHSGLAFYTIGQRKGLGISSSEALYVVDKDIKNNTLIVGSLNELGQRELYANNVNWISGKTLIKTFRGAIKIRYKAPLSPAKISPLNDNSFKATFSNPIRDITPGQAAVIYIGEEVIASGIIDRSHQI